MAERESVMVVIQNQLEAMSPRDRRMLAVLACFGALVIAGVTSWFLMGVLDDKASRVVAQKDSLEVIQAMAEEHQQSIAIIEHGESRLKRYQGQRFKPFVEQEAARLGLELGTINDQPLNSPKLIRFTDLTEDEYFVTEAGAKSGVTYENTSETEPMVILR